MQITLAVILDDWAQTVSPDAYGNPYPGLAQVTLQIGEFIVKLGELQDAVSAALDIAGCLNRCSRQGTVKAGLDPCPQCGNADLEPFGAKMRCPACSYLQPCCQP